MSQSIICFELFKVSKHLCIYHLFKCLKLIDTCDKKNNYFAAAEAEKSHCPLCHLNFPDGDESWKNHLMGKDGYKHNSRCTSAFNKGKPIIPFVITNYYFVITLFYRMNSVIIS